MVASVFKAIAALATVRISPTFAARSDMHEHDMMIHEHEAERRCSAIVARNTCPSISADRIDDVVFENVMKKQTPECIGEWCNKANKDHCCIILRTMNRLLNQYDAAVNAGEQVPTSMRAGVDIDQVRNIVSTADAKEYLASDEAKAADADAVVEDSVELDEAGYEKNQCLCQAGSHGRGTNSGVGGQFSLSVFKKTQLMNCAADTPCQDCTRADPKGRYYCCARSADKQKGPCGSTPEPYPAEFSTKQCMCGGTVEFMSMMMGDGTNSKCLPGADGTIPSCAECSAGRCGEYQA